MKASRLIAIILTVVFLISVIGCAGNGNEIKPENTEEGTAMHDTNTALGKWLDSHGIGYEMIDSSTASARYVDELEKSKAEGYTPVIVVDDGTEDSRLLFMFNEYDVEALLKTELPDGKDYLDGVIEEYRNPSDPSLDAFDFDQMRDESAGSMELHELSSYLLQEAEGSGAPVLLVKVPTDKPWEVVLYLPFGGWNACPEPIKMAAVCKLWYEKYSACPALITGEEMNFYLPSPVPESEVGETALEHVAFCEDSLFQGMGYMNALEDYIKASTFWYFWWD